MTKNKYIIDYISEMSETLKELKLAVAGLSSFIMMEKEESNADNQEIKKRGRKKKQSPENDGGTGAPNEPLQHSEVEEGKGDTP